MSPAQGAVSPAAARPAAAIDWTERWTARGAALHLKIGGGRHAHTQVTWLSSGLYLAVKTTIQPLPAATGAPPDRPQPGTPFETRLTERPIPVPDHHTFAYERELARRLLSGDPRQLRAMQAYHVVRGPQIERQSLHPQLRDEVSATHCGALWQPGLHDFLCTHPLSADERATLSRSHAALHAQLTTELFGRLRWARTHVTRRGLELTPTQWRAALSAAAADLYGDWTPRRGAL